MIYLLLYFWVFYLGFIFYAGCQNAIVQKRWRVLIPALPVLFVAGVMDVLFNQIFGRLLFWEITSTWTFSQRLDLHYKDIDWRGNRSRKIGSAVDSILPNHIR
jgi:hypothetical protein